MSNHDGFTQEEFDKELFAQCRERGVHWMLSLPGVYEIVAEELNNDVFEALRPEEGGNDE